jgi:predicted P-loop ATPase
MSQPKPVDPPKWLQEYLDRGFQLVFYDTKTKGPTGKDAVGWVKKTYTAADYKPGDNVGVKLGTELTEGRYLVDIDLDWGGIEILAKRLLPPSGFGWSRSGRKITHALYTLPQPIPSKAYADISGKTLIELRCRKIDNSVGLQTMLPPSVHPSGENIEMRVAGPITHEPDLPRAVLLCAIAAELYYNLGDRGFLHAGRVGFAGFLLQLGLTEEETVAIGEAIAEASGNNVADIRTSVNSTATKLRQGEKVTGKSALVEAMGENGKKVVAKIKEYLGGGDFVVNDKDQILANNQENIRRALKKMDVNLSYDLFGEKEMVRWNEYVGPLNDKIRNRLWLEMDELFHFRPQADFFDTVILDACHKEPYHPILQYLEGLKWDGKPRLDEWLINYAGAGDSDYTRAVSSLILIAAVRRVRSPGCKFDELMVLESPKQGMLKSSALRALCPHPTWFSDDLPLGVDSKQIIERTSGKWIIEAAELSGLPRAQVEHLKSMLSRQVDGPVRLAYARMPVERPRQFIIVGTTNSNAYLKDHTGNRRFWPIRIERFNIMQLTEARDQLWAEAAKREADGESTRLDITLYDMAELQQSRRKIEDSWEAVLTEHFTKMEDECFKKGKPPVVRITSQQAYQVLGIPVAQQDERVSERLSRVLQTLGFKYTTIRLKGITDPLRGWQRYGHNPALELKEDTDGKP